MAYVKKTVQTTLTSSQGKGEATAACKTRVPNGVNKRRDNGEQKDD